jgi:hypothetical protein
MSEETVAAFNRLRRLQEQNLANIPAMIAQRALGTFTLQAEPPSEETRAEVRVLVYPQDPFIGEPEVRTMQTRDIRPGLVNSRVRIRDRRAPSAHPDSDGNYLHWAGTPEFDQVNCFYYTTFTLRMYERFARRELPWSFPLPRIDVDPHAGDGANAFYSEQDRLVGFYSFQANGQTFNAAQSADVISHETGHAVLDGLRDLHNESFGLGPSAFHESFGDMASVLVALHDDSLITRVLNVTNGDMRVENFIASVAEYLQQNVSKHMQDHVQEHTVYLRNALNTLKFVPFDALPYIPTNPETELGRESHNYSRLFTGAFYDILAGVYEYLKKTVHPRIAIHRARDIVGHLVVSAIELGPVGEFNFGDMAKAFLAAAHTLYSDQYAHILSQVFAGRGILTHNEAVDYLASLKSLPDLHLPKAVNSALDSALFFEDQVIPALQLPVDTELTPMSAYRNAAGNAYLTYFSHRRLKLEGAVYRQFNGAHVDAFGGLALMFNSRGKLCSAFYRPVIEEDVRQIGILTGELIGLGKIADPIGTEAAAEGTVTIGPLYSQPGRPNGIWVPDVTQPASTRPKLVKFPVLFDAVPRPFSDLLEYLRSWQRRA